MRLGIWFSKPRITTLGTFARLHSSPSLFHISLIQAHQYMWASLRDLFHFVPFSLSVERDHLFFQHSALDGYHLTVLTILKLETFPPNHCLDCTHLPFLNWEKLTNKSDISLFCRLVVFFSRSLTVWVCSFQFLIYLFIILFLTCFSTQGQTVQNCLHHVKTIHKYINH